MLIYMILLIIHFIGFIVYTFFIQGYSFPLFNTLGVSYLCDYVLWFYCKRKTYLKILSVYIHQYILNRNVLSDSYTKWPTYTFTVNLYHKNNPMMKLLCEQWMFITIFSNSKYKMNKIQKSKMRKKHFNEVFKLVIK